LAILKGTLALRQTPPDDPAVCLPASPAFAAFVESTTPFVLDGWQRVICDRLERLRHERGQRILIHVMPQAGKSILVSQRFPAWLLGTSPANRIRLACYNITHATRFSKMVLDVMRSPEYARFFPGTSCKLPRLTSNEVWSTAGRSALRDAQPSFKALGLATGFVGTGADTLIIDDPYASPQDALSETIRESVWTFWSQSAKVRLNDDSNVVVMFHRYHEDDLAGRLFAEGGWEMLRFPAIADGDAAMPDPMGRAPGEKLSPRFSDAFLAEQQKSPSIWLGQFQGRPLPPGGGMLKRLYFPVIQAEDVPPLRDIVAGVDLAVTAKTTADFTVASPLGVDAQQNYYLFRPARGQWEPSDARREIAGRVRQFPLLRRVGVESVAAFAAFVGEIRKMPEMVGYSVVDVRRNGDKVALCAGWQPIAEQRRLFLVDDGTGWHENFLVEAEAFPLGKNDDWVDSVGIGFDVLRASAGQSHQFTYRGQADVPAPRPGPRRR